jgi:TM2 domain-containing membrane protein YozV
MSKIPLLAGILSLIIPGLGYFYMGKVITGLIVMFTFFATVIIVLYGYFYHSIFSGIPELAFINLWPFFYFIWIPLAYDVYRTVKKENKIKIMENSEINEKIN